MKEQPFLLGTFQRLLKRFLKIRLVCVFTLKESLNIGKGLRGLLIS